MRTVALAAVMGASAALVAAGVLALGGAGFTSLETSAYDRWLRARSARPASPALLVVVRDAASELDLGKGSWDRVVHAALITRLSRAGAAVVAVDTPLGQPSAPGRGGASSDALVSQALGVAGNVVFPITLELTTRSSAASGLDGAGPLLISAHPSWPALAKTSRELPEARALSALFPGFGQHARVVGHVLAAPDPDGIVRRVPLFVRLGERGVPALGLGLASAFTKGAPPRIRVDRHGEVLVGFVGPELSRGFNVVPFSDVVRALDAPTPEALEKLVGGRIVLLMLEPAGTTQRTPVGPMSDIVIQAHLLNTVLTQAWVRDAPAGWAWIGVALLAALTAWLWLTAQWWKAAIGLGLLAVSYIAGLVLSPSLTGLLLPLVAPLIAMTAASAGALVWSQLTSASRIDRLEGELAALREALVRQESSVEGLEEDLEAARAAAAQSTGGEEALRAELAAAREQEGRMRARLEELEQRSRTLGAGEHREAPLLDAEQERLRQACERLGIDTRDPGMLVLFRDLEKAARSPLPILVTGEPGTGKELFARAAHHLSPRADGPFVAVNMAAIPAELFESEMFGHVRGSFTGAVGDRKGFFEQANRGTIFLDEVGELRPEHQSKLLRVLQDKSFFRVGATRPTTVDTRVVAASNRDLERGVTEGWFREDLYFRVKGFVLRLPALRERKGDIPLLAARFVRDAATEIGRAPIPLAESALAALERGDWPGNVRELQACVRQAVALADGAAIGVADLRLAAREPGRDDPGGDAAVLAALRRHGFDMQVTARALGWDRSTVTQRLKGLGFRALVESGGDRAGAAQALAGEPALERTVELKLAEYTEHLLRVVQGFSSADEAIAACRRRFKNLPERHFRSLELLVRQHFDRRAATR
jgi:transcriptional regulator with GAF, ATPase, and Fis domain/CHASE2 domain-containing sensor protein